MTTRLFPFLELPGFRADLGICMAVSSCLLLLIENKQKAPWALWPFYILKAESHACGINIFFPNQKQLVVETASWAVKENQPLSPWEKRSFLFQGKRALCNWRKLLDCFQVYSESIPIPSLPSISFPLICFLMGKAETCTFLSKFSEVVNDEQIFQLSHVGLDCWCCLRLGFSQLWVSRVFPQGLKPDSFV